MRAAVITEPGGPEVFQIQNIDDPKPGPEEVLVEVKATALNRADLLQRRGRYPSPPGIRQDIPGLEMAGIVTDVGERVFDISPGTRVFAILSGEGYSSKLAIHHRLVAPIPDNLSYIEAAAVPEVFIAAYDALFNHCGLTTGESVLIHAAGSGVGTAAIQLARNIGAKTFGTASTNDKLSKAYQLGLNVGVNYKEKDFAEVIKEETSGNGVNVVLDVVGASHWDQNISSLAVTGRMVIIGTLGGFKSEANISTLMFKRLTVRGSVIRTRPAEEKMFLTQQLAKNIVPMFETERLKPVVDKVFPLEEVSEAHTYMETNANFGKIILTME